MRVTNIVICRVGFTERRRVHNVFHSKKMFTALQCDHDRLNPPGEDDNIELEKKNMSVYVGLQFSRSIMFPR